MRLYSVINHHYLIKIMIMETPEQVKHCMMTFVLDSFQWDRTAEKQYIAGGKFSSWKELSTMR